MASIQHAEEDITRARNEYKSCVEQYERLKESKKNTPRNSDPAEFLARKRMFEAAASLFAVKAHYAGLDGSEPPEVAPSLPNGSEYFSFNSGSISPIVIPMDMPSGTGLQNSTAESASQTTARSSSPPDMTLYEPKDEFYTVIIGRRVGVYSSWEKVEPIVRGLSHEAYRVFETQKEAVNDYFEARAANHVQVVRFPSDTVAVWGKIEAAEDFPLLDEREEEEDLSNY